MIAYQASLHIFARKIFYRKHTETPVVDSGCTARNQQREQKWKGTRLLESACFFARAVCALPVLPILGRLTHPRCRSRRHCQLLSDRDRRLRVWGIFDSTPVATKRRPYNVWRYPAFIQHSFAGPNL